MNNKLSPTNKNLEALIEIATRRASFAQSLQTTFVYRPGEVTPSGNVYNSWPSLYAAFSTTDGPRVIQIDDSIVSPAVIPAGTYDLVGATLTGLFRGVQDTMCNLADGVVFLNMSIVSNTLVLNSLSTSVPVFTAGGQNIIFLERGSNIQNGVGSTVPFIFVPPGSVNPVIIVLTLGGGVGAGAVPTINVGAGSAALLVLDTLAELANNVIVGPGLAQVIVTSQSAFLNTPFPVVQAGVGTLFTLIFQFANFTGFSALSAGDWVGPAPTNVEQAINRMSALLVTLSGGPIP